MDTYTQLITQGYFLGNTNDIFLQSEISEIRSCVQKDIEYNFQKQHAQDNNWQYFITCDWPIPDSSKNAAIRYSELKNKLKQIEEHKAKINQSWYYKDYSQLSELPFSSDVLYSKLNNYIAKIYNVDEKLVKGITNITYYSKNDFISVHKDGQNKNRICGLLIYLESTDNYKKEYGGRLFLQPANQHAHVHADDYQSLPVIVDPVSPNMIILDFSKNNIYHAVEKCYENFYRTSLLTFFTLDDI